MSQQSAPSQIREKNLSPEKCAIVYGRLVGDSLSTKPLVVAAFSMRYGTLEMVNSYQMNRPSYFTLYLPEGQYQLFVFADCNNDSLFTNNECVGQYEGTKMLTIEGPEKDVPIVKDVHISFSIANTYSLDLPFSRKVEPSEELVLSEFYPPGSIRSLDSDLFSHETGLLGMYNPPAFLERASLFFYALEEHDRRKIPVVFVHGITGTCRDWQYIVEGINREKFEPWFFYYPSGEDLDKLAEIFYELFLSGNIVNLRRGTLVICAHSMGGVIARAAINRYSKNQDFFLKQFITICSPYGGNEGAARGSEKAPVVVPSWRDVATGSEFITQLHKTSLPKHMKFHLLFGYRHPEKKSNGDNSDGTITIKSQLDPRAQALAHEVHGFNETHTSILQSKEVLDKINTILDEVK